MLGPLFFGTMWYIIWFLTQESIGFNFFFWANFHNLVAKKKSVNWIKMKKWKKNH
jgi:hypothetical protein